MNTMVEKAKEFIADKVGRQLKKPEAEISDVSVQHLDRSSATFLSRINISNPYDHSIPICEISYTLKSANKVVASGTMPDPGSLNAMEKTVVEVPMKVPYDFLMSILGDIGKDWDVDYEMELGLTVDLPVVGNFTIPLTKKGETRLPTLKDIF